MINCRFSFVCPVGAVDAPALGHGHVNWTALDIWADEALARRRPKPRTSLRPFRESRITLTANALTAPDPISVSDQQQSADAPPIRPVIKIEFTNPQHCHSVTVVIQAGTHTCSVKADTYFLRQLAIVVILAMRQLVPFWGPNNKRPPLARIQTSSFLPKRTNIQKRGVPFTPEPKNSIFKSTSRPFGSLARWPQSPPSAAVHPDRHISSFRRFQRYTRAFRGGQSEATAKKKATTTRFLSSRTFLADSTSRPVQSSKKIPDSGAHTLYALFIYTLRPCMCVFFPVFTAKKALPTDHSSRYCQVVQDMSRMTLSVSSVSFCPSRRHSTAHSSIIIPCIIMIIHPPPATVEGAPKKSLA